MVGVVVGASVEVVTGAMVVGITTVESPGVTDAPELEHALRARAVVRTRAGRMMSRFIPKSVLRERIYARANPLVTGFFVREAAQTG
jgi:hypothetical protein